MSANANRPPVVAIGFVAVAAAAVVYFVFLRGTPVTHAAKTEAPAGLTVAPVSDPTPPPKKSEAGATTEPPMTVPQDGTLRSIRDLCEAGKWTEARGAIGKIFATDMPDAQRTELAPLSERAHDKILAGGAADIEFYEIQSGDSLSKIANRYKHLNGCYGPILIANQMKDPGATLRLGRRLRIPKGTWSVVVDKSLFTLWICYEGAPIRSFKVAIGREEKTPPGVFVVGNKNPKPAWYPPQEMIAELKRDGVPIPVPYGHPKNPLGEYWVALDHKDYQGLGIHGTNDPGSIGSRASNGCVRMDNREVLLVAWTVGPGTITTILE